MDEKIKLVLNNVQQNASCHQKYLKVLKNHYHKIPFEEFTSLLFKYLRGIFHMDIAVKNPYVERVLDFLAQFVSVLTKVKENDTQSSIDEDSSSHPFLTSIIDETLKFHDLIYVQARYYSCRFITLILQHIGHETHLDNDICDAIQESMLERILDPKASIRLQAVMALVRLQEPLNPDCPVVKAYHSLIVDANPLIRKEVVKRIAPNSTTIPKIKERLRDVDFHVRIAAFGRCSDIGPKLFKIIARQQILRCGFGETNKLARQVFMENLLPKWFSAYNGDFLAFLSALKLDADENDIVNTEEISKQVMEVFFRTVPVKDIINALPIGKDKLIPINNLSSEVITYWSIVTNFLRSSDETEEYLDNILPELTPFCNYIENLINFKTANKMEDWEYLDYQYMLYNLFEMAEQYDLSDEVGRRTFHKLVMSVLQDQKLQFRLAKKVVSIADKLISNVDIFTNEMCQIISDIREPLIDKPTTQEENRDKEFQTAELKVKINILQGEIEDALDSQDFQKASMIQNELAQYKRKLEDLNKQAQPVVKVKVAKDDPETICRCIELLTALLQLPSVKVLSPSLTTCKDEFVLPLLTSNVVEVNWRILKCLTLFSTLDRDVAAEHAKVLCIPIVTYRAIPNYNKAALMESVAAVCDLMRIHGPGLFGSEEDVNDKTASQNSTRRRLYRNEDMDDVSVVEQNRMTVEFIVEIILDMLDDENEEIRETAVTAIAKLILNEFPVNPLLISRIILKWFNPMTGIADSCSSQRLAKLRKIDNEKSADRLQQQLGTLIGNYTREIKGAREIIEKAVVPTLTSIASAPRTSPLADVDVENVLRFLAAITNSGDTTDIVHIHTNLAHTLCYKIANKPKDPVVPYLTRMLLYLEIPPENSAPIKELITQAELLLQEEDSLDKAPRKSVGKFVEKLQATIRSRRETAENQNRETLNTIGEETAEEIDDSTEKDASTEQRKSHTEENPEEAIAATEAAVAVAEANAGESASAKQANRVIPIKENTTKRLRADLDTDKSPEEQTVTSENTGEEEVNENVEEKMAKRPKRGIPANQEKNLENKATNDKNTKPANKSKENNEGARPPRPTRGQKNVEPSETGSPKKQTTRNWDSTSSDEQTTPKGTSMNNDELASPVRQRQLRSEKIIPNKQKPTNEEKSANSKDSSASENESTAQKIMPRQRRVRGQENNANKKIISPEDPTSSGSNNLRSRHVGEGDPKKTTSQSNSSEDIIESTPDSPVKEATPKKTLRASRQNIEVGEGDPKTTTTRRSNSSEDIIECTPDSPVKEVTPKKTLPGKKDSSKKKSPTIEKNTLRKSSSSKDTIVSSSDSTEVSPKRTLRVGKANSAKKQISKEVERVSPRRRRNSMTNANPSKDNSPKKQIIVEKKDRPNPSGNLRTENRELPQEKNAKKKPLADSSEDESDSEEATRTTRRNLNKQNKTRGKTGQDNDSNKSARTNVVSRRERRRIARSEKTSNDNQAQDENKIKKNPAADIDTSEESESGENEGVKAGPGKAKTAVVESDKRRSGRQLSLSNSTSNENVVTRSEIQKKVLEGGINKNAKNSNNDSSVDKSDSEKTTRNRNKPGYSKTKETTGQPAAEIDTSEKSATEESETETTERVKGGRPGKAKIAVVESEKGRSGRQLSFSKSTPSANAMTRSENQKKAQEGKISSNTKKNPKDDSSEDESDSEETTRTARRNLNKPGGKENKTKASTGQNKDNDSNSEVVSRKDGRKITRNKKRAIGEKVQNKNKINKIPAEELNSSEESESETRRSRGRLSLSKSSSSENAMTRSENRKKVQKGKRSSNKQSAEPSEQKSDARSKRLSNPEGGDKQVKQITPLRQSRRQLNFLQPSSSEMLTSSQESNKARVGTQKITDTSEGETDVAKTKRNLGLKRTRRGTDKSGKHDKKGQDTNHNDKDRRTNQNQEVVSETTDTDGESGVRRRLSKRTKKSLDRSDLSEVSKDSEKENKTRNNRATVVSEKKNEPGVVNRRSVGKTNATSESSIDGSRLAPPIAESTRNNSHRSLRNMVKSPVKKVVQVIQNITLVKGKKSTGRKSQDLNSSADTTLHTIIEDSFMRMETLEESSLSQSPSGSSRKSSRLSQNTSSTFSTPQSKSRRRKLNISETTSDSESSIRKSARKIKKKNMDNYVV